jgi:hypothetical protein
MMPNWNVPNVTCMSALACRTFNTVVQHMGIFHLPTFRLSVCYVQACKCIAFCFTHLLNILQDAHDWTMFAMCTTAFQPGSEFRGSPLATNIGETPIIRQAWEDMDNSPEWAKTRDLIRREVCHPYPSHVLPLGTHIISAENRLSRQIILSNNPRSKVDRGRESSTNPFLIVVQCFFIFIRKSH